MTSHEFEFINNIAYINLTDTKVRMATQPFNPATQQPWTSEEEARTWAFQDYGYLLTNKEEQ